MRLPYLATTDLERSHRHISSAVIGIHGMARDAAAVLSTLRRARRLSRVDGDDPGPALLLVPVFPVKSDARAGLVPDDVPCWSAQGWKEGNRSVGLDGRSPLPRLPSFAVIDLVLERLADRQLYPALRRVALVGHSAGGQVVQRHAAASALPDRLTAAGVTVLHLVANASSYLYLDERRPTAGGGFARPAADDCPDWNRYKYGLEEPNSYVGTSSTALILDRFRRRDLVYLLGTADDDMAHPELDRSCAARLQGCHRLERGRQYHAHLASVLGPEAAAQHRLVLIEGVGHDARGMLTAAATRRYLFGGSGSGSAPATRP